MKEISLEEALVAKLHRGVLELADYTCSTLIQKNVLELAKNNPSFTEISEVCQEVLEVIQEYSDSDDRIQQVSEVITILDEIVLAIPDGDNALLVDCTCHLEQFLEINVRKF